MTRTHPNVLAVILAGGEGKRLLPLTQHRAKPAVPFGGTYRLIDFVLSNFANAGYLKILVLTQYKSHSLERHIAATWGSDGRLGTYVKPVSAQMRCGPRWFSGSGDAVFQNLNLIDGERPDVVCVFGADHVYRMDPRQMVHDHLVGGAGVTVGALRVPRGDASSFGIIEAGPGQSIVDFVEKPADPPGIADDPASSFASMGNYVFDRKLLVETLEEDAEDPYSNHDFGGDIIPKLVTQGAAQFYDFTTNEIAGENGAEHGYWRDVGTIDAYHAANMDLVAPMPRFNLYLDSWPTHTYQPGLPAAKLVSGASGRAGEASDTLLCPGSIISGARVTRSIVGPKVYVEDGAVIEDSVLLDGVRVGRGAVIRRAVIDKEAHIPDGAQLGVDPVVDAGRFSLSAGGVVVVPKRWPQG